MGRWGLLRIFLLVEEDVSLGFHDMLRRNSSGTFIIEVPPLILVLDESRVVSGIGTLRVSAAVVETGLKSQGYIPSTNVDDDGVQIVHSVAGANLMIGQPTIEIEVLEGKSNVHIYFVSGTTDVVAFPAESFQVNTKDPGKLPKLDALREATLRAATIASTTGRGFIGTFVFFELLRPGKQVDAFFECHHLVDFHPWSRWT